jgi:hypothetical protein
MDGLGILPENLGKCPEALGAGDHDVRFSSIVMSIARNPDGRCQAGANRGWQPLRLGHSFHNAEQEAGMGSFFIEGIGGNAWRHVVA